MKSWFIGLLVIVQFALVACGGGGGGGDSDGGDPGNGVPYLVVTAFSAPSSATAGGTYTVTGKITNQGDMFAPGAGVSILLSPNSDVTVDGGLIDVAVSMGVLESGQSWNFSTEVEIPHNIANGDYYIGAVPASIDGSKNSRSQAITITGGATCTADGYEADNSFSAAKPLGLGESQQHNHCEGTSDWMSFSATSGMTYGISVVESGYSTSTGYTLYGTDGSTILASKPLSSNSTRLNWTAPSTGTYYLKVSPFMGLRSSGADTEYQVTLGEILPDLVVEDFSASETGLPGGTVYVSDSVRNLGFATAGSFDVSVYLSADPNVTTDGTLLGTRTVSSLEVDQSNNHYGNNFTLPATLTPGVYYLAEFVNSAGTLDEVTTMNNMSVVRSITVEALGSCTPDAYEEDDVVGGAKPITVGAAAQSHNHCEDGVDWLSFAAQTGKNYAVRVVPSGLSSAWAEIYASDGSTLLAGSEMDETTAIDWQAPAGGNYYIKVGSYAGRAGEGRDYKVLVKLQLPDLTQTIRLDNGNSVMAGGLLKVTDAVSNAGFKASGPFEIGFYRSATETVTTSSELSATRSVADLPAEGSYSSTNQNWNNVLHFPKNLTPGTYYVAAIADRLNAVAELNENNNASAPLAVTVVAPLCAVDAYEDDDTQATAQAIVSGATQTRNFCDDGVDWIKFTPSTSGAYIAESPSSTGDLELYQGATRIEPQATYFYSKLAWNATAGVDYFLKYYRFQGATAGDYQFAVSQCNQDSFEEDDTLATAKSIAVGQTQTRNHCEDKDDWAKFTAVAGTTYTITASNGQNVYTTLYDGANSYLASGKAVQGGKYKVITWIAPANATYYIHVDQFEFGLNTDYTLTLN